MNDRVLLINSNDNRCPEDNTSGLSLRGFTLVEVMVAAVIMALTIGGLFSIFISSGHFIQRANRRLAAINLIRNQLERRREFVTAETWNNASTTANLGLTGGGWTAWIGGSQTSIIPRAYRYRVVSDPNPGNPVPEAAAATPGRRVFMQVRWGEPN